MAPAPTSDGRRAEVDPRHHLADGSARRNPAARQQHHGGREPRHLVERVADEQDRDSGLAAQAVEVGQDLALARLVERGERLVEKEEAGCREQAAADRHPLLLATRQRARAPVEQVADAQELDDLAEAGAPLAAAGEPAAVEQVAPHREVREQPGVLEHVADAPPVARHVDAPSGVEQGLAVEQDAATVRPQETGDAVDDRGLAGTRTAEQGRDAVRGREGDVEIQRAQAARDLDLEHQMPRTIRATGRASSSEAIIAAKARAIDTSVRRRAPDLAAGDLGEGVDRRGQGLGLARDVGDEGDGGAELAQRLGIGQHHAGHHAGQRQRQGDRGKHPGPRRAKRAGRLLELAVDGLEG